MKSIPSYFLNVEICFLQLHDHFHLNVITRELDVALMECTCGWGGGVTTGKIKHNVAPALRGNPLDSVGGFWQQRRAGSDVMSGEGAIFINLQPCHDLNMTARQLVDCDWLTKPVCFSAPMKDGSEENKCTPAFVPQSTCPIKPQCSHSLRGSGTGGCGKWGRIRPGARRVKVEVQVQNWVS